MNGKRIIGIAGPMGAGKDTAANILVGELGFRRIAMADALKQEVSVELASVPAMDALRSQTTAESLRILRGWPLDICHIIAAHYGDPQAPYRKPTSPEMRRLLQWWGTERRRAEDVDYWVKRLEIAQMTIAADIVIPDIRFPNEAAWVRKQGGRVWWIWRESTIYQDDTEAARHVSENSLSYTDLNYVIPNDSTVADLRQLVLDHAAR